jgi:hypothetical protein
MYFVENLVSHRSLLELKECGVEIQFLIIASSHVGCNNAEAISIQVYATRVERLQIWARLACSSTPGQGKETESQALE